MCVANRPASFATLALAPFRRGLRRPGFAGGKTVKHAWSKIVGVIILVGTGAPTSLVSQTMQNNPSVGPFARIAIMRALDGHGVDWEAGYIRHLEWHRQAKDTFNWYSY